MSSITILARSTTTPSRTALLPRTVTEPSRRAPQSAPSGADRNPHHWWGRRRGTTRRTELSPRVVDLQIRSVAMWPRGYR